MKKIIAGAIVAIPLMMTTLGAKASASEVFVNRGVHPIASRSEVLVNRGVHPITSRSEVLVNRGVHPIASRSKFIARARHRVLVPGRWEYRNHHRGWVKAHYEWRY